MAQYRKKIVKLSKGQLAKQIIERTDIGILDSSGQLINCFRISKFGGLYSTKGTKVLKTIGDDETIAKKYKISLPNNGRSRILINFTDQIMYIINNSGTVISNELDISDYLSEDEKDEVQIAQQGTLVIMSSLVNPLLKITIEEADELETYDYEISIGIFEIEASSILKATTINSIIKSPSVILLSGALPTSDNTGLVEGMLYLGSAPTPPSSTFPWSVKRYDGMDTAEPPAIIWTDVSYTAEAGDTVQYQATQNMYAWSGTAWSIIQDDYTDDKEYSYTVTPTNESGIVTVSIGTGLKITAPTGQDPYTYAKNLLSGIWLECTNSPAVCYIQDIKAYSVSGQDCTITSLTCYTLISFIDTSATTGFTLKFSMKRAFDSDYAGTPNNPEGTSNFPLFIFFYQ